MKVTLKTISGGSHEVELAAESTARDLKLAAQQKLGGDLEQLRLVHKGRHIDGDEQLSALGISDGAAVVVMTLKKHVPAASAPTPSPAPIAQSLPAAPSTPAAGANAQLGEPASDRAQLVTDLSAMGFPASEVEAALRAAFYNRERAVEYLLNGIPAASEESVAEPTASQTGEAPTQIALTPAQATQLHQLITTPEFENIRRQAIQNPQILHQLMAFLQEHRPELLQLFQQYPALLAQVIAGEPPGEEPAPATELSEEDKAAIRAMQAFGFSEQQCVEAYLLCDRNQELAVNYLLDEQNSNQRN